MDNFSALVYLQYVIQALHNCVDIILYPVVKNNFNTIAPCWTHKECVTSIVVLSHILMITPLLLPFERRILRFQQMMNYKYDQWKLLSRKFRHRSFKETSRLMFIHLSFLCCSFSLTSRIICKENCWLHHAEIFGEALKIGVLWWHQGSGRTHRTCGHHQPLAGGGGVLNVSYLSLLWRLRWWPGSRASRINPSIYGRQCVKSSLRTLPPESQPNTKVAYNRRYQMHRHRLRRQQRRTRKGKSLIHQECFMWIWAGNPHKAINLDLPFGSHG